MIDLIVPPIEATVFNVTEGESLRVFVRTSGFSYGNIPVNISLITYAEFMNMGFNLTDEFAVEDLPADAAEGRLLLFWK